MAMTNAQRQAKWRQAHPRLQPVSSQEAVSFLHQARTKGKILEWLEAKGLVSLVSAPEEETLVYFIQGTVSKLIKIGFTKDTNPLRRYNYVN